MNKNFFADMLKKKPNLMQGVVQFNNPPTGVMPLSLQELSAQNVNVQALWSLPKIQTKLNAEQEKKNAITHWDFTEESKRLLLYTEQSLSQLILYFGATFHAKNIAQIVLKEDVLRLKNLLGDDLYSFALARGAYCFAVDSPSAKIFSALIKDKNLEERIFLHGLAALIVVAKDWEEDIKVCFYNILKNITQKNAYLSSVTDLEMKELYIKCGTINQSVAKFIWFNMKKLLNKELAKICAPYFN